MTDTNKNYLLPHETRTAVMAILQKRKIEEAFNVFAELINLRVAPSLSEMAAARAAPPPPASPASPPMSAAEMAARHAAMAEQEQAGEPAPRMQEPD